MRVRDKENNPDTRAYVALNRILSCLKTHSIWAFFLSTESSIRHLIPPDTDKPADPQTSSSRYAERGDTETPLERVPPFLALQMDIKDRRRVMNPNLHAAEFRKPFAEFSEPRYMARFGRPLWYAYNDVQTMGRRCPKKAPQIHLHNERNRAGSAHPFVYCASPLKDRENTLTRT
jgi:hypothetical protein